jgi:hypothetical protein
MCSVIVYFLHCICVCDCDGRHESLIMLLHSVIVRRSHLLARCYLGTMCMCTTVVRCSTIEGILHRCYCCGPIFMLEDKGNYRGSSLQMVFRIFRCHRAFKPMRGRLTPHLGTSSLLSLHVDVWRLIFLKLSLPRDGMRRCSAPCNSIPYVRSFFKNGNDLTELVILQVIMLVC